MLLKTFVNKLQKPSDGRNIKINKIDLALQHLENLRA